MIHVSKSIEDFGKATVTVSHKSGKFVCNAHTTCHDRNVICRSHFNNCIYNFPFNNLSHTISTAKL